MTDVTIPGGKIRAFVARIENLDIELQELNEQKKEVFAEAKGEGFDVKILKGIIKLRKQDQVLIFWPCFPKGFSLKRMVFGPKVVNIQRPRVAVAACRFTT
jgi:uncharacterized protein (UPF0335 family)